MMAISRRLRKITGPAYAVAVCALSLACSSSKAEPGTSSGGGSAAGTGTTGGSSTGGGSANPRELVGSFQIQVTVDDEDPSTGATSVIGKVSDGPAPATVSWEVAKTEGSCQLEKPSVPFCDPACEGGEVCVANDACQAYPTGHSVGEVRLDGVQLVAGASPVTLKEIAAAYQPPAGTAFAYPPFAEGDDVTLTAAGGDYMAFQLSAKGVAPLTLSSSDFEIATGKALTLTWAAAQAPQQSQIHVRLEISHHGGGSRGVVECDTDDTGALTIPSALLDELVELGVAGFPTLVVTRSTTGSASIAVGQVNLVVSSKLEQAVTVNGVVSCTEDTDCSDGKICQMDLTCQ
jgi:hypothetical protein